MSPAEKLIRRARRIMRWKHYSYRTEKQYIGWIRRYIRFHSNKHPVHMGRPEIEAFLSNLAAKEAVAASTRCRAVSCATT